MNKKRNEQKFMIIKKTIKSFVRDEDGFVSKDNILKIGLGAVTSMGILGAATNTYAQSNHIDIWPGADIYTQHNHAPFHQNSLGLVAVAGYPECQMVQHANSNVTLSHSSHNFHLHGVGVLNDKGAAWAASMNYDNWNNG